jgi:succinate dehydrogenase/fumarate reductase flavoprotein subunit
MSFFDDLSRRELLKKTALTALVGSTGGIVLPEIAESNAKIPGRPESTFIKSEEWKDGDIVETDLLIVGSGFAGLWAAISAADSGVKNITLVDRGAIGNSSNASMVMGGCCHFYEGEDINAWIEELIKGSGYLSRQDMWRDLLSTSPSRLAKMQSWGLKYGVKGLKSDGNKHVFLTMAPSWNNINEGKSVIAMLLDQVQKRKGIKYFSKTFISQILTANGKAAGAIGVHRLIRKAAIFKAKAMILAAGQCSFSGQHVMMEMMTGSGYALAYNAGAVLNNMEFWSYDIDPGGYGLEGGSLLGSLGARVINNKSDEFLWKYDPEFGMDTHVRLSTRAMAMEVKGGRGPITLDQTTEKYRTEGRDKWRNVFLHHGSWQRLNEFRLVEVGHDVTKKMDPFYAFSFGIIGAVKADINCQSTLPGLYAAGVTISHDPGKIKGCESARAFWSGEKSGKMSAEYIRQLKSPAALDMKYAENERKLALAPLDLKGETTPTEILTMLQQAIFPYDVCLLKTEDRLKAALKEITRIKEKELPDMFAENPHELVKFHETKNMLLCAELFLLASIERKESRECHYREDYPVLNNKEWLKWINFTKGSNGAPQISFERVPVEKYPIKPKEV